MHDEPATSNRRNRLRNMTGSVENEAKIDWRKAALGCKEAKKNKNKNKNPPFSNLWAEDAVQSEKRCECMNGTIYSWASPTLLTTMTSYHPCLALHGKLSHCSIAPPPISTGSSFLDKHYQWTLQSTPSKAYFPHSCANEIYHFSNRVSLRDPDTRARWSSS